MDKRWNILKAEKDRLTVLQHALNINKTLCNILVQRDIDDFEKARSFFRPQLSQLHDPYLMKDMGKAIHRINIAITNKERIMVFGDYDVPVKTK